MNDSTRNQHSCQPARETSPESIDSQPGKSTPSIAIFKINTPGGYCAAEALKSGPQNLRGRLLRRQVGNKLNPNRGLDHAGRTANQVVFTTTRCSSPVNNRGRIHCRLRRSQGQQLDKPVLSRIESTLGMNTRALDRQRKSSLPQPNNEVLQTESLYRAPLSLYSTRSDEQQACGQDHL